MVLQKSLWENIARAVQETMQNMDSDFIENLSQLKMTCLLIMYKSDSNSCLRNNNYRWEKLSAKNFAQKYCKHEFHILICQ